MSVNDFGEYLDKDWQQAHRIDRPGLPCEVVQVANAVLGKTERWIGEDTFQASVISHTLWCDACQRALMAWIASEKSFEKLEGLLGKLPASIGDEMIKFLKNKYMMGSKQVLSISCEEVQIALLQSFRTRFLPDDNDFVATFIGHVCICRECSSYLGQLMESFRAEQLLEGEDS